MIRSKNALFTAGGVFAMVLGILIWNSAQGNAMHFASGFLLGMSLALLILGLARPSRRRLSR